jgi:glutamine---fructose-6-phosphate transaminase (isomerizing)
VCGIIAVLRGPGSRQIPDPAQVTDPLAAAVEALADPADTVAAAQAASEALEAVDALLRVPEGVAALVRDRDLLARVQGLADGLTAAVIELESALDARPEDAPGGVEAANAALIRLKDAVWAVARDRIGTARAVSDLVGSSPSWSAIEVGTSIQQSLSALDRLEVRGRDSAGLSVLVRDHDLDLGDPAIATLLHDRLADHLFRTGAVRTPEGHLCFVYKAAAEIGELGDNTRALRAAIRADELLRLALAGDRAVATVLGHTRWASVGIISQPNAHPLDSLEDERIDGPLVTAVLNGDVDNFADLRSAAGLRIPAEITTDAKVIPTLVSRARSEGAALADAFRDSVASFEGSVAIAASAADHPDRLLLALRGSGQALYVGCADGAFIVASEPYGVVELTSHYLRLDGETPADADNPTASRGQIVVLDGTRAGTVDGIERQAYDGTPLPVSADELVEAQITTRDIDRGDHPHYLLKEINESPASFRKTLRGKLVEHDGTLEIVLGPETLPDDVRARLRTGDISRVQVIGQGTAHIAGSSLAAVLASVAPPSLRVESLPATELSGFGLRADMSDTLVVAISQSGTTTDTNRTVDLVRSRGAAVIAIVNRRQSDLTDRADGVLYTSDGRDVEMSVASTKAFYAQVAAGFLLAGAIGAELGSELDQALLAALRDLPTAMEETADRREQVALAAQAVAPSKRYWAIVGNGPNRIAAAEVRIKLSELCYKSIACDATEDKKHIDLSSEPLILVCAAGLTGSTADDVAKEVAIYRAHSASPVVIATDGEHRFAGALHVLTVPPTHPLLGFVLGAMVGHLFGYEAALAIDAQAMPLREIRSSIEELVSVPGGASDGERLLGQLRPRLTTPAQRFFDGLRAGRYDGHLEAGTAVRVASSLRYGLGVTSLDAYQFEHGRIGTPAVVIDDLTDALTSAIEELTRPVDAIKHQAKTVTVGISRSDETLLQADLVQAVLAAGAPRDRLTYRVLRTLSDIDPVVAEVTGWIRYDVEGDPEHGEVPVSVVDRGGIAADIPSRTDRTGVLRGTKHTVAVERQVFVTRGRVDGRTLVIVPETKDDRTTSITLLHVRFHEQVPLAAARGALQGYRNRWSALRDAVLETEPTFREDLLAEVPTADLLVEPIRTLADRFRTG